MLARTPLRRLLARCPLLARRPSPPLHYSPLLSKNAVSPFLTPFMFFLPQIPDPFVTLFPFYYLEISLQTYTTTKPMEICILHSRFWSRWPPLSGHIPHGGCLASPAMKGRDNCAMNMDIAELHSTYETAALASAMSSVLVAHSAHHPVLAQRTPCTCAVLHPRTGREPASLPEHMPVGRYLDSSSRLST